MGEGGVFGGEDEDFFCGFEGEGCEAVVALVEGALDAVEDGVVVEAGAEASFGAEVGAGGGHEFGEDDGAVAEDVLAEAAEDVGFEAFYVDLEEVYGGEFEGLEEGVAAAHGECAGGLVLGGVVFDEGADAGVCAGGGEVGELLIGVA